MVFRDLNSETLMQPISGTGTVGRRSSGGGVCNEEGKLVGLADGYPGNSPDKFYLESNPKSIQQQFASAMEKAKIALAKLGFGITE